MENKYLKKAEYNLKNKIRRILKTNKFHLDSRKLAQQSRKPLGIIIEDKKSVSLNQIKSILNDTNERIYVCISNENSELKNMKGNHIKLGMGHNNYINPFDLHQGELDFELSNKKELLFSVFELIIERKLTDAEISTIYYSLSDIYKNYKEDSIKNIPILNDLIQKLLVQEGGVFLGLELEKNIKRNLSFFNKKTNIDIFNENRLNIFDISTLNEKEKSISMLIINDFINYSLNYKHYPYPQHRLYIEDIHLLLRNIDDYNANNKSMLSSYFYQTLIHSKASGHLIIGLVNNINFKYISFLNNLKFGISDLQTIYNKTVLIYGYSIYYENNKNYCWDIVAKHKSPF